jgi:hypothetical protein
LLDALGRHLTPLIVPDMMTAIDAVGTIRWQSLTPKRRAAPAVPPTIRGMH